MYELTDNELEVLKEALTHYHDFCQKSRDLKDSNICSRILALKESGLDNESINNEVEIVRDALRVYHFHIKEDSNSDTRSGIIAGLEWKICARRSQ